MLDGYFLRPSLLSCRCVCVCVCVCCVVCVLCVCLSVCVCVCVYASCTKCFGLLRAMTYFTGAPEQVLSYPVWTLLQASSVGKQTPPKKRGGNESGGGDSFGGEGGGVMLACCMWGVRRWCGQRMCVCVGGGVTLWGRIVARN